MTNYVNGPRVLLEDILDILGIDIHLSLVLKENLPKVYFRFDENFSSLIFQLFNYYKLSCNIFENAILLKRSPEYFKKDMTYHFKSFSILEEEIKRSFKNKKSFYLLKDLSLFLTLNQFEELSNIVNKSYKNGNRKNFIISGKDQILSVYLSLITLMFGLKNIDESNTYIFYYQPFYNKVNGFFDFVVDKSIQYLDKKNKLILSYRFCNRDYTVFEKNCNQTEQEMKSVLNLLEYFEEVYISFIENSNLALSNLPENLKKKIIIDNNCDMNIEEILVTSI